ncbi:condensation domain-containing protein [Mycolicibacterium hodleri]|uniref:condensation domain-containing protein n=1 Tax=Mycolicibacterium hodleri TaxID=49897 RepID=UPI0021F3C7EF|nr:condensation domain-containing protein [Mycolicibacterium hodleri]
MSIRPIGALERQFYRYAESNPVHFSIVAEFDVALDEDQLRAALDAVQGRHPLLRASVDDHPSTRLGFYQPPHVGQIPLDVHHRVDAGWTSAAADDLARPFDRSTAPLMRATLVLAPDSSALLLTLDHTIADGISSVNIVDDLLTVLNGGQLTPLPVPPAQEDMIAQTLAPPAEFPPRDAPAPDPRMGVSTSVRPYDGAPPNLHAVTMQLADTARLVERCRTEQTTVHAAVVTAASHVRAALHGQDYVRVLSPINFRALIKAGGDCAAYFTCTCTGMAPADRSFWDQARALTAELTVARSAPGIQMTSAAIQQFVPVDADLATAQEFFTKTAPWDLLVSNLGVQDLDGAGPIRPTALWGPIVRSHIEGDAGTGVVTYEGRLRMISCGYTHAPEYLDGVLALLIEVSKDDRLR